MDGYKCLKAGQPVLYEVNEGPKGLHASNIRADTNASAESEASKTRTKETATAEA
jgi:CspA family cold shock protein